MGNSAYLFHKSPVYPLHGKRVFLLLTAGRCCVKISDKTIMAGCCRNRKDSSAGGIGMDEHQSGVKLEEALSFSETSGNMGSRQELTSAESISLFSMVS